MDLSGSPDPEITWAETVRAVVAAVPTEDALDTLLARLAPATGASAAAMVVQNPPRIWASWQCDRDQLQASLTEMRLPEGGAGEGEPTLAKLEPGALPWLPGSTLVVPLRPGGSTVHHLLLFLPPGEDLAKPQGQHALAVASLANLLLERELIAEEARQAQQARDHFLIAMHHELRTPATALMLEAGLLRSGILGEISPRLDGALERLEAQVEELVRVVGRVLDLASLETGAEPGGEDLVDPRETVIALARRVEPSARRKGISLALYFPRSLPLLQTDAGRFRRVLLCLLANALKYTQSGTIQIRVERNSRAAGPMRREPVLLFKVFDTGCGIPAAELERIFEPFAQVDEGARTDSGSRGVGLGLPLARKLARSLEGEVTLESTVGEGTVATFSIPCRPADAPLNKPGIGA
jgi:signal transduction histidine kinase